MIKTIKENKNYKKNSAKTDKNKQNKEKKSQQISNRENNTKMFHKTSETYWFKISEKGNLWQKVSKNFYQISQKYS